MDDCLKAGMIRYSISAESRISMSRSRRKTPYATDLPARRVGMYSRTPKVCSCFMCGNPRRFHQKPSIRERRTMLNLDELIREAASPLPQMA